jgi:hypothetical protein
MSQGCWGWFLRNVLRQDDERIPDNVRACGVYPAQARAADCLHRYTSRLLAVPVRRAV